MKRMTLVVMAAGIGSRYGGGVKQLEAVGPSGEIIMDYSIYDAVAAGFNKVVFVIRRDLEKDFKEIIGSRIEKAVEVAYAYQELSDIPEEFRDRLEGRTKPWGTGQAVLSCKDVVKGPFLVINADDYYGKEAYREARRYLEAAQERALVPSAVPPGKLELCMVGFVLKNTLSENGTVTRGICKVSGDGMLEAIEETYGIREKDGCAVAEKDGGEIRLDPESPVSMNMWGFPAGFPDVLDRGFSDFLRKLEPGEVKKEYLLPRIIGELLEAGKAQVKVLESRDRWFGVTYQEDKQAVAEAVRELVAGGAYPEKL